MHDVKSKTGVSRFQAKAGYRRFTNRRVARNSVNHTGGSGRLGDHQIDDRRIDFIERPMPLVEIIERMKLDMGWKTGDHRVIERAQKDLARLTQQQPCLPRQ